MWPLQRNYSLEFQEVIPSCYKRIINITEIWSPEKPNNIYKHKILGTTTVRAKGWKPKQVPGTEGVEMMVQDISQVLCLVFTETFKVAQRCSRASQTPSWDLSLSLPALSV